MAVIRSWMEAVRINGEAFGADSGVGAVALTAVDSLDAVVEVPFCSQETNTGVIIIASSTANKRVIFIFVTFDI